MQPETLQGEFVKLLEMATCQGPIEAEQAVALSDEQMFQLWNLLGEELGIDLALATEQERSLLFEACQHGKRLEPKHFGSLLWLVYYGDGLLQ
jgi:hypothetical protein